MIAVLAELKTLNAKLKKARPEVKEHEAAAVKEDKARSAEKVAEDKDRARVFEVEETLKGVFEACDKLQVQGQRTKEELEISNLPMPSSRLQPGLTTRCSSNWSKLPQVSNNYYNVCLAATGVSTSPNCGIP